MSDEDGVASDRFLITAACEQSVWIEPASGHVLSLGLRLW